jgi:hypothetical protein
VSQEIKPGDRVRYGIRTGEVLRLTKRRWGMCAVVQDDVRHPGDGAYPHEVPVAQLTIVEAGE